MSRVADVLDVKGHDVLAVTPDTTVLRVAQRMRARHVGAFVVSGDGRHLDGLVSEREIVYGLARQGPDLLDQPVTSIMTRSVRTCRPDDSVRAVMAEMTRERVRHLPVVEHGELCGIISIGDVVKACVDDAELEANVLREAYLASRSR